MRAPVLPALLLAAVAAGAQTLDEMNFDELRAAAEYGDADAQFHLGFIYSLGLRGPQDYAEAARWFRKAAEQGDAAAQFRLGVLYAHGEGVPEDDAEAVRWLHKAAEQGYATANDRS